MSHPVTHYPKSTTAEEDAQWQRYYAQNKTGLSELHPNYNLDLVVENWWKNLDSNSKNNMIKNADVSNWNDLKAEQKLPYKIKMFAERTKGGRKHRSVKRSGRKGRKISRRKTRKNSSSGRKITGRRKTIRRRKTHRRKTVRR
jgi:hypothetical protein